MWQAFGVLAAALISGLLANWRENEGRQENYKYNEMSAENSDTRTRTLFNDLYSPSAQVGQLKDAGLSTSLYYSGGVAGSSGATGAQGAGASGIQPNVFGVNASEIASIKNTEADTELKEAEADKTKKEAGLVEEKAQAQIALAYAEKGYKEAATALTNEQKTGEELKNYVTDKTKAFKISEAENLANKLFWEAESMSHHTRSIKVKADVDEATKEEAIKERSNRNKEIAANIALKAAQQELAKQQKSLTDAQESAIIGQTNILWGELEVHQTEAEATKTNAATNRIAMWNQANQFAENLKLEYKKLGIELDKMTIDAITKVAAATLVAASRGL